MWSKTNGDDLSTKYRAILEVNMVKGTNDLRLSQRLTFQQENKESHLIAFVLNFPSQILDIKPIEHFYSFILCIQSH